MLGSSSVNFFGQNVLFLSPIVTPLWDEKKLKLPMNTIPMLLSMYTDYCCKTTHGISAIQWLGSPSVAMVEESSPSVVRTTVR